MLKKSKTMLKMNILLFVSVLFIFNIFAWFIYSTAISNTISTKVKSWRINFEIGDNELIEYINLEIGELYPGMPAFHNEISIINYGETSATISFEIESVRILSETYDINEYTHEELLERVQNDYPFVFLFLISDPILEPLTGVATFTTDVTWPFESGDDNLDTLWGQESYNFAQENPTLSGVAITLKLTATQNI